MGVTPLGTETTTERAVVRDPVANLEPRSNARGELSRADWRFTIPTDEYADVLLMGLPRPAVLEAVARSAHRIVVAMTDRQEVNALNTDRVPGKRCNVRAVHVAADGALPLEHASIDLVVFSTAATAAPRRSSRLIGNLASVVRSNGTVYLEGSTLSVASFARRWRQRSRAPVSHSDQTFWLIRRRRETIAAIPLDDVAKLAAEFLRGVLYGRSRIGRIAARVARVLARRNLLHHVAPARALVLRRHAEFRPAEKPFAYLVALGARNGRDLSGHRSALLARGAYDSNKVAVYFFDRLRNVPDVIVKMTRAPEFNHRLGTEYRSLRAVASRNLVDAGTYPEALFLDTHLGLAVLAETVVPGSQFRMRTTSRPDCPFARDAINWITRLGTASAETDPLSQQQLSRRLSQLLERVVHLYDLSTEERDFLESRIAAVAQSTVAPPMVFRHGDAGTWNILVTDAGRAAFLDWEVSEPQGPPLWDLFDFVRSFGTWIGRVQGGRDSSAMYESAFLGNGPLAALQVDAVREYCRRVGVQQQFVEPLFYACWMQRAVREAAWSSAPLADGTYIKLLRLCIRRRSSPGLTWLLD